MNFKLSKDVILDQLNTENLSQSQVLEFDGELDIQFGIPDNRKIESSNYQDLTNEALSTSYFDYYKIFKFLGGGKTLIDLGAGFCRGTLLAHLLNENLRCISLEIDHSRIQPAKSFLSTRSKDLIQGDIFGPSLPGLQQADALFLYLPAGKLFYQILKHLLEGKRSLIIIAIESHGQLIPHLDLFPSLFKHKMVLAQTAVDRHDRNIYVYHFDPGADLTPREKQLLDICSATLTPNFEFRIQEEKGTWITSTENCELYIDKQIVYLETVKPRRLVSFDLFPLKIFPRSELCNWFERQSSNVIKLYVEPNMVEHIDGTFTPLNKWVEIASGPN